MGSKTNLQPGLPVPGTGVTAEYTYKSGKYVWTQTPKKDKPSRQKYAAYKANPTHYMIDDGHAKARAKQQAEYRAQAVKAAKEKADKERRRKDGILGSIWKGNFRNAWENTKESDTAQWVTKHRAGIATFAGYASIGICLATAGVGCAIAGGVALGASYSRTHTITESSAAGAETWEDSQRV
ncbi:hypothetical protein [Streptomyces sp. NPDC096323]|uniref:hypothetical protein n=1 Tax=Streptomyces sp. NPDC096323 TaxID=3155822 RepID=UPI003331629E